jgi:hypothetical protein
MTTYRVAAYTLLAAVVPMCATGAIAPLLCLAGACYFSMRALATR